MNASVARPSVIGRLRKLARHVGVAADQYGLSRGAVGGRLLSLYWRRGFRPGEALRLGLTDPKIAPASLDGCFTKEELFALQNRLNPVELTSLTEDKSVFDAYCAARAIPVPKHFATLGRVSAGSPEGHAIATREAWLRDIAPNLPSQFITKPALGVYGAGVSLWTREGTSFRDHKGRLLSADALYEQCCGDPKFDRYVVQQRLLNHPALVELTGSSTLQTVRLVTLIDTDGTAQCLYAEWKLAIGESVTDNFAGGVGGNLVASVRLSDGTTGAAQAPAPSGIGSTQVHRHPVTGAELEGFRLPDWTSVTELALRAARTFLPLCTIGWDIALTPDGPVIVEGNRWWDPPNDAVIGPPAPGLDLHELATNGQKLRTAAQQVSQ